MLSPDRYRQAAHNNRSTAASHTSCINVTEIAMLSIIKMAAAAILDLFKLG